MIPYQWIFRPPIVTSTGSIPILISTATVYGVRVAQFPAGRSVRAAGFPPVPLSGWRDSRL
jgi:hypothetical protein